MKARERGAKLIHVDPHFSRTSAMCQQYVPIRTGSDIAFLGGLISYILENDRWFREYVMAYTNASTIIKTNSGHGRSGRPVQRLRPGEASVRSGTDGLAV